MTWTKPSLLSSREIARVAHEVNRAYCASIGDHSQKPWDQAPAWQRESAVQGVHFHMLNPNANPSASHDSWCEAKLKEGWIWGEVKDEEKRTHPCLVPFEQLPQAQQTKDHLFKAVCLTLLDI